MAGNLPTVEGSVPREVGTDENKASSSRRERSAPLVLQPLGLGGEEWE